MPFVQGFLRVRKRGRPDIDPPDPEGEVDPGYGIDEGGEIGGGPIIPEPPPGIWPPLTPENPWRPVDPGYGIPARPPHVGGGPARPPVTPGKPEHPLPGEGGEAGQLPTLPPGVIWPPLPPGVHGKFLALVLIGATGHGAKYRYVVIDADARPPRPVDPDYGVEGPPPREPKR